MMPYRQADSLFKTLTGMKIIEAFKAYRGRIGLLMQEIERRLNEIPNPVAIGKLRDFSMLFTFGEHVSERQGPNSSYYTFELEDHARIYASGWVYRYEHDEDPPFRRIAASAIKPGDFIFIFSDELRTKLESSLMQEGETMTSVVDPARMLLKLYHDDVQTRCRLLFRSLKRAALAREIRARMVELHPLCLHCRSGRVYYWLAPLTHHGTRPHASKDAQYFRIFCKALGMNDDAAERHWHFIKNARRMNQTMGCELSARYAEILFQPESAVIYRKVPVQTLRSLQEDALHCVSRVERVIPPSACVATNKKDPMNACSQ
ncbi:hypothetical protein AAF463_24060 (plasmid) [Pantoea sp. BJ2]|uniref:Uncharacterized protein n=1 Tax=Pantoea sp. BJ2 TaxID=3141322 RepID=A0AAU7U4G0_9GAMM